MWRHVHADASFLSLADSHDHCLDDPQTHTLTPTGSMTAPRAEASATTLADGRVLVVGGYDGGSTHPLSTAEIYNPATGTFSTTGNALEPLLAPSSILLPNGRVLVVAENSITAELYDPATGKFSVAAQMPVPPSPGPSYRMFNLPNGTVLVNNALSLGFNFYHP